MWIINRFGYLVNQLEWKYFIGEYKPGQEKRLESAYKWLTDDDKDSIRGLRILLDTIANNPEMKEDLGSNGYNLFSNGLSSYVNFRDISKLVVYKVNDLSSELTLFDDVNKIADSTTKREIKDFDQIVSKTIKNNFSYLKNFPKAYIVICFPSDRKISDYDWADVVQSYKMIKFEINDKDNQAILFVKDTK